jgi:hypothetical protein
VSVVENELVVCDLLRHTLVRDLHHSVVPRQPERDVHDHVVLRFKEVLVVPAFVEQDFHF